MHPIYEPGDDSFLLEECLKGYSGENALDMGTGNGLLARALVKKFGEVTAVDVNPAALERVGNIKNCNFVLSNLFEKVKGRFDLIVFNPPYLDDDDGDLRYSAGRNGQVIRDFFEQAKAHLHGNGKIVFILSSFSPLDAEDIHMLGYEVKKLKEKKMAWETITVYEAELSGKMGLHLARGVGKLAKFLGT